MPEFHQIWHGKSEELVQRIKLKTIDAVITDPPFGSDNQSNMAKTPKGKDYARKIENDASPEEAIATFKRVFDVVMPRLKDEAEIMIFTSYQVLEEWLVMTSDYFKPYGFARKAIAIWKKDGPGMGDLKYPLGMGCEFILCFRRGTMELRVPRRNSVLSYPQIRPDKLLHPHEKPQGLLIDLAKMACDPGGFILDPFGGSGSMVRASRTAGMNCVACEMNAKNHEIADNELQRTDGGMF